MSKTLDKIDDETLKVIKNALDISKKFTRNTGVEFKVVVLLRDCILSRSMEEELIKSGMEFFYVNQEEMIRFVYDPIYYVR